MLLKVLYLAPSPSVLCLVMHHCRPYPCDPMNLRIASRSGILSCCLVALNLCVGCQTAPPAPTTLTPDLQAQVNALLEAADGSGALVILDSVPTDTQPMTQQLRAQALAAVGRFVEAQTLVAAMPAGSDRDTLRQDTCVGAALVAATVTDAVQALAPCSEDTRIDVRSLALAAEVQQLPTIDMALPPTEPELPEGSGAMVIRLEEPAVNIIRFVELQTALHEAADGPEKTVAANALEAAWLAASVRVSDPVRRLQMRVGAFEVGQAPELGETLIADIEARADELATVYPQGAATLYELLFLRQIEGLEVSDEVVERTAAKSREALFPIFRQNFMFRYNEKHLEDDMAEFEGYSSETLVARFAQPDPEARRTAIARWLYRITERPAPTEVPDFMAEAGICEDLTVPCLFPLEQAIRIFYRLNDIEAALSVRLGHALTYVNEP